MARPATGMVVEARGKRGTVYAIRFSAYKQRRYVTLGGASEGWNRQRAEQELANVLADVRRGIWAPPATPVVGAPKDEPTFHVFASEWFEARKAEGLAAKTVEDLRGSLSNHLLPHFATLRLSEITVQEVDRYKIAKARQRAEIEAAAEQARKEGKRPPRERGLSNGSINHTLRHLAQVLETAVEYGLIESHPAAGKRRRLKATAPVRPWVEPEQLPSLLDATSGVGRLLLTILAGAGLRIGEALALRWRHVDLGTGTLHVVDAKTPKGIREVHLSPALREELTLKRAEVNPEPDDFVLATSTGGRQNPSNLRRDVLAPAVKAANKRLASLGIAEIGHLTFHSLRRTYASLRCCCGDDVRYTADQLGHEDPRFTLRVYAKAAKRRDRLAKTHRAEYDRAVQWAEMCSSEALTVPTFDIEATKSPV